MRIFVRVLLLVSIFSLIGIIQNGQAWRRRRRRRSCSPVNCSWSGWSGWGACSASCGGGTQARSRSVTSGASCGGSCSGGSSQSQNCNTGCCPVSCLWASWQEWGPCEAGCGDGVQRRMRMIQTQPSCDGEACTGSTSEERACKAGCCPVNCQWEEWADWTSCSKTCNEGEKIRNRGVRVAASCGGADCSGHSSETTSCNEACCPTDCIWAEWQPWDECSVKCGDGMQRRMRMLEQRATCGGIACVGATSENKDCNPGCCPVNCQWKDWGEWTRCSATCDEGQKTRIREVLIPAGCNGAACDGRASETTTCNEGCCPVDCTWSAWNEWTVCSKICGRGKSSRTRKISIPASCGGKCQLDNIQTKSCNDICCPTNCMWEEWSDWSECSRTCGNGSKRKTRRIRIPASCGGFDCNGVSEEISECNLKSCPILCNENPYDHFERLPFYCNHDDGSPRYSNTGYCPRMRCGYIGEDESSVEMCCGPIQTETIEADCGGSFSVPMTKFVRCGCHDCEQETVPINFLVIGVNETDMVADCLVKQGSTTLGRTDNNGFFTLNIAPSNKEIVLTFIEETRFLPTKKIINILNRPKEIVQTIKLILKPPIVRVLATQPAVVKLASPPRQSEDGSFVYEDFLGEAVIPPNSIQTPGGHPFVDEFDVGVFAIDKDSESIFDIAPGSFKTVATDNSALETKSLRNFGLFEVFIQDKNGQDLYADEFDVKFDALKISNEKDRENMHIYSFDENSGLWLDEGNMDVYQDLSHDGEVEAVFLVATIPVRERRLFSLNVLMDEYCYAKVRTYLSNLYDSRDQVNGVEVRALYFDIYGSSNGYSLEHTQAGQGSCVMVPCSGEDHAVSKILFTASIGDDVGFLAASSSKWENMTGLSTDTMNTLSYRRSDHFNSETVATYANISIPKDFRVVVGNEPPFYHHTELENCLMAPYESQHFRFYKDEIPEEKQVIYEFNTISTEPFSPNPLNWWQKERNNEVCFIKIKLVGKAGTLIQVSSNYAGEIPDLEGKIYGFRENFTIGNDRESFTCLEFKCSKSMDNGAKERTLVKVKIMKGNCRLDAVNVLLDFYSKVIKPVAIYPEDGDEFHMYSPPNMIGADFGVFMQTGEDSRTTVSNTFDHCMDWEGRRKDLKPALVFNCQNDS